MSMDFWVLEPPSYYRSGVAFFQDLAPRVNFSIQDPEEAAHEAFYAWHRICGLHEFSLVDLNQDAPFPLLFLMPQAESLSLFGAYATAIAREKGRQPPANRLEINEFIGLGQVKSAALGGRIDFPLSYFTHHLVLGTLMKLTKAYFNDPSLLTSLQSQFSPSDFRKLQFFFSVFSSASRLLGSVELLARAYSLSEVAEYFRTIVTKPPRIVELLEKQRFNELLSLLRY